MKRIIISLLTVVMLIMMMLPAGTPVVMGQEEDAPTANNGTETVTNETEIEIQETPTETNETQTAIDEIEIAINETQTATDETGIAINETQTATDETQPITDEAETAIDETNESPLVADFIFDLPACSACSGITFTDKTSGGVAPYTYDWDFGDGSNSTEQNPTHSYTSADNYTVILTVTDSAGDIASKSENVTLNSAPETNVEPDGGALVAPASETTFCTTTINYTACTDKADYASGETAHINGYGFAPGANLTIKVTRPDGSVVTGDGSFASWPTAYDAVIANGDGGFQYDYILDGINGEYLVEVLDGDGNVLASHTFTDSRTINSVTLTYGTTTVPPGSLTVPPGATITATVNVTTTGSGSDNDWQSSRWRIGDTGSYTLVDHEPDYTTAGTYTESFNITAPSTPGTYSAYFRAYSDDGGSSGQSSTFPLTNAVVVATAPPTTYNLTVTSEGCGSITVGSLGTVTAGNTTVFTVGNGTSVILTAQETDCCDFTDWTGNATGSDNPKTIQVTGNMSMTGHFATLGPYSLYVESDGCGNITVSGTGIPGGSQTVVAGGNRTFTGIPCGTDITLTAVEGTCCNFENWTGDATGSQTPTIVSMTDNKSVVGHFAACVRPELQVDKTVETIGCREYQVTLNITGAVSEQKPVDVIIVFDRSGSMQGTPLTLAKQAANTFIDQLTEDDRVGLVSYSDNADNAAYNEPLTFNHNTVKSTINSLTANGYTNIGDAIYNANQELINNGREEAVKVLIVFSDGVANRRHEGSSSGCGTYPCANTTCTQDAINQAQVAKDRGYAVFSIFFQNISQSDCGNIAQTVTLGRNTMKAVASDPDSDYYYETPSAEELEEIFLAIAGAMHPAFDNVVVTDTISQYFYIGNITSIVVSQGSATYDNGSKTITWDVGSLGNSTETLTYVAIAEEGVSGMHPVNDSAEVNYEYDDGTAGPTVYFPNPEVFVVDELVVTALSNPPVCEGATIELYGYATGGGGNYTWSWTGPNSFSSSLQNPSIGNATYAMAGNYTLSVICSDGCMGNDIIDLTVVDCVPPTVTLDKSVSPLDRDEPGGEFTYTLNITNTSDEPVTVTNLTDTNGLSAGCLALIGEVLDPDEWISCTYTKNWTDSGTYPNTANVTVEDNDGQTGWDDGTATATVNEVTPTPTGGGGVSCPATKYLTVDWEGNNTTKPLYSNDKLAQDLLGPSFDGVHSLLLEQGTHAPTVGTRTYYLIVVRELELQDIPPLPENITAIVVFNITPAGAEFDRDILLTLGLDELQLPENALNISMAYYDDVNGVWVPLEYEAGGPSGVAELTLSAPINHFSIFGVLAELAPTPPEPAHFAASGLSIVPSMEKTIFVTKTGESVTIAANIANDGGQEGDYPVVLKLNGETVDTKTVTLDAGQSQTVSFTRSGLDYGQYDVEVAGLSDTFTASRTINWWLIILIIVAIGLIIWGVVWGRRRRRRAHQAAE